MAKDLEQAYNDADSGYQDAVSIPRSMPPDGLYTAYLKRIVDFSTQDGELVVIGIGEILEGEYQGREFVLFRSGEKTRGFLKEAVNVILGQTGTLRGDVATLDQMTRTDPPVLAVSVTTTTARNGNEYSNARIEDLISGGTAETSPENSENDTASEE